MEKEQRYKASVGPYADYMHRRCLNCGAMTHITKWCLERPRKIAKLPNIAPKENIFSSTLDFKGKQDPSNGYDAASFENKDGDALKGDDKYTTFGKALKFKQLNSHALKAYKNKKNTQQLAASLSELYYSRVADIMMGKYDNAEIPRELLLRRIESQVAYDRAGSIIKGQVANTSTRLQATAIETPNKKFVLKIHSGGDTAVGPRRQNEDEHILVDDLSAYLGSLHSWPLPNAFYAVFDGHGGSDAATYVKNNAMRFFFEDADLPQASDDAFLKELEDFHHKAFLRADRALRDDSSVSNTCGTTALTALVLGRHLVVANAGDCRAVLCRKGVPVQLSQDHRPSYLPERTRVEELGGTIQFGYLDGELGVTRALGDWGMKLPFGSAPPLTAEPDVHQILLTEDDEFFIMASDGIWDVMSNQEAVDIVWHELRQRDDPQQCAKKLVDHALELKSNDNFTAIVVCFP